MKTARGRVGVDINDFHTSFHWLKPDLHTYSCSHMICKHAKRVLVVSCFLLTVAVKIFDRGGCGHFFPEAT